jgi:hypothetical protein
MPRELDGRMTFQRQASAHRHCPTKKTSARPCGGMKCFFGERGKNSFENYDPACHSSDNRVSKKLAFSP